MTVRTAFPIYINEIDWDLPDWWYDNLLEAGFDLTEGVPEWKENFVPAFTDENIEKYPVLRNLKQMFNVAIRDLVSKYDNPSCPGSTLPSSSILHGFVLY